MYCASLNKILGILRYTQMEARLKYIVLSRKKVLLWSRDTAVKRGGQISQSCGRFERINVANGN